jgi:hypothetical protein
MKLAMAVSVFLAMLTMVALPAQQPDESTPSGDPAKVTYAPTAGGFGDLALAHAYEMSWITCELEGKLDSKTAKIGDRVVIKTTGKVQTADGTVIPRGTRLVGRVTEAQAYDEQHGPARIAIAFDRTELKNGESIAVHTLIRSVHLSSNAVTGLQPNDDNMMGMPVPTGAVNGGRTGPNYSGMTPGRSTNQVDRTSDPANAASRAAYPDPATAADTTAQGSIGLIADTGAHGIPAARAIPHPTGIPGVMLAGNSTSSGVLLAPRQQIRIDSGTQIEVGVVADR